MRFCLSLVPLPASSPSGLERGAWLSDIDAVNAKFAEYVVAAIVLVWLATVVAALIDPSRAALAGQLAPVIGTIGGGAIAVLTLVRQRKNGNGGAK